MTTQDYIQSHFHALENSILTISHDAYGRQDVTLIYSLENIHQAINTRPEGRAHGVRIIIRRIRRGSATKHNLRYGHTLYALTINDHKKTETPREKANKELHLSILRRAHAIEKDPTLRPRYERLHTEHKRFYAKHHRPQDGYTKYYPTLFGFLYATVKIELAQTVSATQASMPAPLTPHTHQPTPHIHQPTPHIHQPAEDVTFEPIYTTPPKPLSRSFRSSHHRKPHYHHTALSPWREHKECFTITNIPLVIFYQ